jgi:hypothetical protein
LFVLVGLTVDFRPGFYLKVFVTGEASPKNGVVFVKVECIYNRGNICHNTIRFETTKVISNLTGGIL